MKATANEKALIHSESVSERQGLKAETLSRLKIFPLSRHYDTENRLIEVQISFIQVKISRWFLGNIERITMTLSDS